MSRPALVNALVQLHRLEKEAKQGDVSRDEVVDRLGFDDPAKVNSARGTGMALLHLPVKTTMDLAWMAAVPVVTALIFLYGSALAAFAVFVVARLAIWAYDSALLYRARHGGEVRYNSSTVSTLLGTYPYKGNWILGPAATVALDIAVVLPFSGLLGLQAFGVVGTAVQASAVGHALLTLVTRASLNTVCALEMRHDADERVAETAREAKRLLERVATRTGEALDHVAGSVRDVLPDAPGPPAPPPTAAAAGHGPGPPAGSGT